MAQYIRNSSLAPRLHATHAFSSPGVARPYVPCPHNCVARPYDNARSDVRAEGFWDCRRQHAYFDVRVFNPTAAAYRNKTLQSCYRRLEAGKRHEYQDRILNVEHGSFSPLISAAGGMGPTASVVFKRLASLLSAKRDEHYSKTILFIRCQIGFALQRSAIRCLRGSRSTFILASYPGLRRKAWYTL